jgi:hypothetical protein
MKQSEAEKLRQKKAREYFGKLSRYALGLDKLPKKLIIPLLPLYGHCKVCQSKVILKESSSIGQQCMISFAVECPNRCMKTKSFTVGYDGSENEVKNKAIEFWNKNFGETK